MSPLSLALRVIACSFTVLLVFLNAPHALAQSTASIEGQVVDERGEVIQGARVSARNKVTAYERLISSDNSGHYQLVALPIGDYELEVRCDGFQTQLIENVRVEVGRKITHDFEMHVGSIS